MIGSTPEGLPNQFHAIKIVAKEKSIHCPPKTGESFRPFWRRRSVGCLILRSKVL